jgi:hypothetical protein
MVIPNADEWDKVMCHPIFIYKKIQQSMMYAAIPHNEQILMEKSGI